MRGDKRSSARRMPRGSWILYVMMIPGLLWILCFRLMPIPGISIAFLDYNLFDGIQASPWAGLKYFQQMFSQARFLRVIGNTFEISLLKLVFLFPLPILLALLLSEVPGKGFRGLGQSVLSLPHFLSYVVIHGIFVSLLSVQDGPVNHLRGALGLEAVNFYTNDYFRLVLILTEAWRDVGWNSLIYAAALSAQDPNIFEAAQVDGANGLQRIVHLTLPELVPVILMMLTLRLGAILQAGTDQILVMYNPAVYRTADVIGTFVYREGIGSGQFSLSAAIGLFESLVSLALVLLSNLVTTRAFGRGLWG